MNPSQKNIPRCFVEKYSLPLDTAIVNRMIRIPAWRGIKIVWEKTG